jgi:hypothetical protein
MTVPGFVLYAIAFGGLFCLACLAVLIYLLESSEIERGRDL